MSQNSIPIVEEATAVAGPGWAAVLTDADMFPSDTVTGMHKTTLV